MSYKNSQLKDAIKLKIAFALPVVDVAFYSLPSAPNFQTSKYKQLESIAAVYKLVRSLVSTAVMARSLSPKKSIIHKLNDTTLWISGNKINKACFNKPYLFVKTI